jgi:hypothetical protein
MFFIGEPGAHWNMRSDARAFYQAGRGCATVRSPITIFDVSRNPGDARGGLV